MFQNYLKTAIRNLLKHKTYSAINLSGLAIGLACCMLILLHVQDELSYDKYHLNADRIYRVVRESIFEDQVREAANTAAAIGPTLLQEFPAIENMTRYGFQHPSSVLISYGDKQFYEDDFLWADSTVFDVFSYKLLSGNPKKALTEPNSLLLTQAMAKKYFGDKDPVGKIVTIDGWTTDNYKITGVLEDLPRNTHLKFDFLGSILGADQRYTNLYSGEGAWTNSLSYTYILLHENSSADELSSKLADFADRHLGDFARSRGYKPNFKLQRLTDIHLHSRLFGEPEPNSNIVYVYVLTAIAILILVIACINYMNLATARSISRAREVGMRKVLGAFRIKLVGQFLTESLLLSFAALLLALGLLELILPLFNHLAGKELDFKYFSDVMLFAGLLGITLFMGILAGSYPAFFLSAFRPIQALKGQAKTKVSGLLLREGLITLQFVASIVLIVSTLVVARQLDFVRQKSLGFDKERIVVLPIRSELGRGESKIVAAETFKRELLENPGIVKVSAAAGVPGKHMMIDGFPVRPAGTSVESQKPMRIVGVDYDYLQTFGIDLIAGRHFSDEITTDADEAFILTASAAQALGWEDPVGRRITVVEGDGKTGTVIGLVRDLHFESLHESIEPTVFHIWPERYSCFAVKIRPEGISGTLAFLREKWNSFAHDQPFDFFFLDTEFDKQYHEDERTGKIFGGAAFLAIFVASLGLLGLSAYATEQRTKEIGVRKVLGATVPVIVVLLSRDFSKWVLVANVVAWPIAYFIMNKWLQSFAFRISIGVDTLLFAGLITLSVAWLTISFQAIKAALTNPVDALRYE